jgi:hypothetical protein
MFEFLHGLCGYTGWQSDRPFTVLIDRNGAIACLAMATVYVLRGLIVMRKLNRKNERRV